MRGWPSIDLAIELLVPDFLAVFRIQAASDAVIVADIQTTVFKGGAGRKTGVWEIFLPDLLAVGQPNSKKAASAVADIDDAICNHGRSIEAAIFSGGILPKDLDIIGNNAACDTGTECIAANKW